MQFEDTIVCFCFAYWQKHFADKILIDNVIFSGLRSLTKTSCINLPSVWMFAKANVLVFSTCVGFL